VSLPHEANRLQNSILASLPANNLEYLICTDDRNEQVVNILQGNGRKLRICIIGKLLQPASGIDQIHSRSSSQSTEVLISLRKPRVSPIECSGIRSIQLPYFKTCTF